MKLGCPVIFLVLLFGGPLFCQTELEKPETTKALSPGRNHLSAGAGLSYWPGFVTSQSPLGKLPEYEDDLRTGYHFSFELARFNTSGFGIGAKYLGFRSKGDATLLDNSVPNKSEEILARDAIAMHFVGIVLMKRFAPLGSKRALTISLFTGQTYYSNSGSFVSDFEINGNGGAVGGSLDFEGRLDKNLWIFARAGGIVGKMRSYDLRTPLQTVQMEPDREKYGSLNQVCLSAGLRFYW